MIGVDNSKRVNPARYVQETLKGAFPHDVPLEKGFVASLFTACFDESGTHTSSPATIVAGFIANTTEWTAFAEDWEKALLSLE